MDSRALRVMEQAKNERRPAPPFTWHSQLFHKHWFCASAKYFLLFPCKSSKIFSCDFALHRISASEAEEISG
jgi:hypothetical protein